MLISPPKDNEKDEIIDEPAPVDWDRIERYLNVKAWLCPDCGLTNFGHNKKCADFRCRRVKP